MSLSNFKLIIEYDGSGYHGWQRQKGERSIQEEIEKALFKMTAKQVVLNGSGRTDAGVHAFGQVANFQCNTDLTPEIFQKGLSSLLPDDIIIKNCRLVDPRFHARYDVKSKIYHYKILNRAIPAAIGRQYAWFIRRKLDTAAMRAAISHLIGTHDFKSFEGAGSPRSNTTRHIRAAELKESKDGQVVFIGGGLVRYDRNFVFT